MDSQSFTESIPNPIISIALSRPDHIVLVSDKNTWTGKALLEQVLFYASQYQQNGIKKKDIIALWEERTSDWIFRYHALGFLGVTVLVIPSFCTQDELNYFSNILNPDYLEIGHKNKIDIPKNWKKKPIYKKINNTILDIPEYFWNLNETRVIIFTSGTSGGYPKPIYLSTSQLFFNAIGLNIRLGHHLDDRWLHVLPFHHIAGISIIMRCAWYITTLELHSVFDPKKIGERLDSGEITQISLVPIMLKRILDVRDKKPFPKELRFILLGGAAIDKELMQYCENLKIPLVRTWGMTESASQITLTDTLDTDLNRVGKPSPFSRVQVIKDRLSVKGPIVKGNFLTHDYGKVLENGDVYLKGRKDGIIVSGGKNISIFELEVILKKHPNIIDAVILGEKNHIWGESVVAIIVLENKTLFDEKKLRDWCLKKMSSYKVPKRFILTTSIPKTSLGKIKRSSLKKTIKNINFI